MSGEGSGQSREARFHELQAAHDRLTRALAHDLREPLASIWQFSQLLMMEASGQLPEQAREWVVRIGVNAKLASTRVARFREYAALQVTADQFEPMNLAELCRETLEALQAQGQIGDCQLEVHGPLPRVSGSQKLVRLLFTELLLNAWQARQAQRPPLVSLSGQGSEWVLTDNGAGLPAEACDEACLPFFRYGPPGASPADDERALLAAVSGEARAPELVQPMRAGMGLAIALRIAELHGGGLSVQPGPDGGLQARVRWDESLCEG